MSVGLGVERDGDGGAIVIHECIGKWRGVWEAVAYDGDKEYNDCGRVITPVLWRWRQENRIVTVGKALVLDRLFGLGGAVNLTGTAVGTSATPAADGDTALTGAVFKAFAATPVRTGLSVVATTSYTTAEANIAINEAALLTASGGVMFNRIAPYLGFSKSTAVALDIATTITQA